MVEEKQEQQRREEQGATGRQGAAEARRSRFSRDVQEREDPRQPERPDRQEHSQRPDRRELIADDPGAAAIAAMTGGRLDLPLRVFNRQGPVEYGLRRASGAERDARSGERFTLRRGST